MNDIRHALRQLILRPGFSLVVIVMLALGIGAATAMFSLYHQVLLRPLPVAEPHRLVNVTAPGPKPGGTYRDLAIYDPDAQFSYAMFRDLEERQSVFAGLAAHTDFVANLSFDERPIFGRGMLVSGSYFDVLGIVPALGRLIGPADEPRVDESAVAVLAHDYWQEHLGGDPAVIGQSLTVNGHSLEIIGVAPAGFRGTVLGTRPQVYVPLTLRWLMQPTSSSEPESRQAYWLYMFARLAPGVSADRAAAEFNSLHSGIVEELELPELSGAQLPAGMLEQFRQRQVLLTPGARGQSPVPDTAERPLTMLLAVTVLVLLIVCVNIANLLLVRGVARAGEMAVRASMGASRARLVRQMLAESLVLVAIGVVASIAIAVFMVRFIVSVLPTDLATGLGAQLSGTAMLFAVGAAMFTLLVFGLVPALRASDIDPARVMKQHASQSSGGRGAATFRGALTSVQIAFSMVLLVLAGLFTQSLLNVARVDSGMDMESVAVFSVTPHLNDYNLERLDQFYTRAEDALAAQPGVLGVGTAAIPLFYGFSLSLAVSVEGVDPDVVADNVVSYDLIGAGLFNALGVPLLAGRDFGEQDTVGTPTVVIVNQEFTRRFGVENAVGRGVGPSVGGQYPFQIIGVVGDAKHESIKGDTPAMMYLSRRQQAGSVQGLFFYVRAGMSPDALLGMIPGVIASLDPEVPVSNLSTLTSRMQEEVYMDRLLSMLSLAFAGLATLLAAIGLYSVLAYSVAQRAREFGLRMALGAKPGRLKVMVLRQVGVMALIGAAVGITVALGLGRAAEAVLFGLSGRDPLVFVAAAAILAVVVIVASWIPAQRASQVAPMEALRSD